MIAGANDLAGEKIGQSRFGLTILTYTLSDVTPVLWFQTAPLPKWSIAPVIPIWSGTIPAYRIRKGDSSYNVQSESASF